jgi:hypothetical protein
MPGATPCDSEPPRSMEYRQRAIRVRMHLDVGFDVMRAHRAVWELKRTTFIGNRVVARHDPVLLDAEDIRDAPPSARLASRPRPSTVCWRSTLHCTSQQLARGCREGMSAFTESLGA